jgi:predicted nuclease of predicted toxin-antitoxin system
VKFLVDAQLPPVLAKFIRENGFEALHVTEIDLARGDDSQIWNYARLNGYSILTKDQDFLDRWILSQEKVPVVLIRVGNCTNRALKQWLVPLFPEIVERIKAGESFIELT